MIRVQFDEPATVEWRDWRERCDRERENLIAAVESGDPPTITELYKEQRQVYLSFSGQFHGKCAYCETLIAENHPGDLDHFRPKGQVTDANHKPLLVRDHLGVEHPHPGYYWMAYDWRNLLPACEDCNRPSKAKTQGNRIGKWDYFPVKNFRATSPGEEELEEPLLIHPVLEDPERHLAIDDDAMFEALTPEGQKCIDVFGLNDREALVDSRKAVFRETKDKVLLLAQAAYHGSQEVRPRLAGC
jgi:hypothetical protein